MKLKRIIAITLAAALLITAAACNSTQAGEKAGESVSAVPETGYVIGYSAIASAVAPWAGALENSLRAMCERKGWELRALSAEGDISLQTEHITSLISQKVDAMVLLAGDASAAVTWVQDINDAGIPVIMAAADVDQAGQKYVTALVGPDQYDFSRELASRIIDKYGADAGLTIVSVSVSPAQYDFTQRLEGFLAGIEDTNYTFVGPEYAYTDRSAAKTAMENYLTAYGDSIDILIGFDDDLTLGAIQAISEAGKTEKIEVYSITGQVEAIQAVKDGTMHMTVQNSTADIANKVGEVLEKVFAGESVEYVQLTEAHFITAENADNFTGEF